MKKNYFLVLSLFVFAPALCVKSYGQLKVSLEEYETRNRVFSGYMGKEEIPVTFNLNVHTMSWGHRDFYSVEGWYLYDKYQEKIPLAGMHTDQLVLYHFKEDNDKDTVLNFGYDEDYSFWDAMGKYFEIEAFEEKITFAYDNQQGAGARSLLTGGWTNGERTLPITVYEDNVDILHQHSVLKIENEKEVWYVDLSALKVTPHGNSVSACKNVGGKIRILLDYQRPSKPYALGMCGEGDEAGYVWLEFDEQGNLLGLEEFLMDSCLRNIHAEQTYEDEEELTYLVMGKEGGDQFLVLDKRTLQLTWNDAG